MHVGCIVGHARPRRSSKSIQWAHGHFCLELKSSGKKNFVQKENSRPTWAQHPHNLLALMVGELAVLKVDHPGQNTVRKRQTGKQTWWAFHLAWRVLWKDMRLGIKKNWQKVRYLTFIPGGNLHRKILVPRIPLRQWRFSTVSVFLLPRTTWPEAWDWKKLHRLFFSGCGAVFSEALGCWDLYKGNVLNLNVMVVFACFLFCHLHWW